MAYINTLFSSVHILHIIILQCTYLTYSVVLTKFLQRGTTKTISENLIKNIKMCLCLMQQELIQLNY